MTDPFQRAGARHLGTLFRRLLMAVLVSGAVVAGCAPLYDPMAKAPDTLEGQWRKDCHTVADVALRRQIRFHDGAVVHDIFGYWDSRCMDLKMIATMSGTYAVGDTIKTEGGRTAHEIDYHFKSFTITPVTTDAARAFNRIRLCGFDNWTADAARQVLQSACTVDPRLPIPPDGMVYDIFRVDTGQRPHRIYFGRGHDDDFMSARGRVTALDGEPFGSRLPAPDEKAHVLPSPSALPEIR